MARRLAIVLLALGAASAARADYKDSYRKGIEALDRKRWDDVVKHMREAIADARREGYSRIFIGYAECGTQGQLDRICAEEGIERIGGPHCYSFFTGNETFAENTDNEFTAFYLTDLLARQFEAFVIEPLKLEEHPELKEMVFGNYTKIVYLAQTEDPELQKKAKWAADYLGLDYEYRFTGYGDLTQAIADAAR